MSFVVRCLFFLLVILALGAFLYLYRRKTNQILLIVLIAYSLAVGSRIMSIEQDDELLVTTLLAVGGMGVAWAAVWVLGRWLESREQGDDD